MDFMYFITVIAWCIFIFYSCAFSYIIAFCILFFQDNQVTCNNAIGKIHFHAILIWIITLAWIIAYYN